MCCPNHNRTPTPQPQPPASPPGDYVYNEGDAILSQMTMEYAILALVGVGVVMLLMMVHPLTAVLMMIAVGMVGE